MNTIYLFTIIYVKIVQSLRYNEEFQTFACNTQKPSITFNLKNHSKLSFSNGFTVGFWFKYKHTKAGPLLSMQTFDGNVTLSIDERRKLKVNNVTSTLGELVPSAALNDFQLNGSVGGWQFMVASFKMEGTKSSRLAVGLSLNYIIQQPITIEVQLDLRELFLVLASDQRYGNCMIESLFYQMYIMDTAVDLSTLDLYALSTGIAKPVFLSKFVLEGSYNKFYTNLITSGAGDIRNGADPSTFTLFSSLSSSNNIIGRRANLANDLSVFFLPSRMLPNYQINSSYIFVIQYDFFYKDYAQASFDNLYYHVLYQRMPSNGVNKLIRADFQMVMGPNSALAYLRYITNDKVNKQIPYQLTLERTSGIRSVPFNYMIIKVIQTAATPNPVITYINGYDDEMYSINANFMVNTQDQHMVGDFNQEDSTRREFLSFVSITEVAFYTGGYLVAEKSKNSPMSFYSGIDRQITAITCRTTNDPVRTLSATSIIMDSCDPSAKESKFKRMHRYSQL